MVRLSTRPFNFLRINLKLYLLKFFDLFTLVSPDLTP